MLLLRCLIAGVLGCALAVAQSEMTCRRADVPAVTIRAEGTAELLSDILIACTGGSPTARGAALPVYQLLAISNTPLSVKIVPPPKTSPDVNLNTPLPSATQLTDALAVVDEPAAANQVACVPAGGSDSCPATAGSATAPNVFQGVLLQTNAVLFSKVAIDPPGQGKTRYVRITNLRASAANIPKQGEPGQILLSAQVYDRSGRQILADTSGHLAGLAKPGLQVTIRTPDDNPVTGTTPALSLTPPMVPQNNPGRAQAFLVRFTEGFPSAFKRRNLGTTGADPNFLVTQADPGGQPNTETGFYNSNFPTDNNLNAAGLADSGTRLKVVLTDIPDNVAVWVSARDVATGTTGYSDSAPRAVLTYSTANGGGPFNQNFPEKSPFALMDVYNNTLTLVWEVVAADPETLESIEFEIRLLAPNGPPRTGVAMIQAGLAPVATATDSSPVTPSFSETKQDPTPAFRISASLNVGALGITSAASFSGTSVAPSAAVAAFGSGLATITQSSGSAPVNTISGIRLDIIDNSGVKRTAPLYLISPNQVNFLLNPETAIGQAVATLYNGSQVVATGTMRVSAVAPALFSADGSGRGKAVGQVVSVSASSVSTTDLVRYDTAQNAWQSVPVDLGSGAATFLTLYGSGIRGRSSLDGVTLTIGDKSVPLTYAGAQGSAGLDQINAGPLPASLAGSRETTITLTVDGKTANPLTITIK